MKTKVSLKYPVNDCSFPLINFFLQEVTFFVPKIFDKGKYKKHTTNKI